MQTFKRFAQIMKKPAGFQVDIIQKSIPDFIQNFGWSNWFTREFIKRFFDENCCLERQPYPILYLYGIENNVPFTHAVVMKGWRTSWFSRKLMLKVRNSAKGQHLFGQDQQGEHEVECMVTRNNNSWNLAAKQCIYIQTV